MNSDLLDQQVILVVILFLFKRREKEEESREEETEKRERERETDRERWQDFATGSSEHWRQARIRSEGRAETQALQGMWTASWCLDSDSNAHPQG